MNRRLIATVSAAAVAGMSFVGVGVAAASADPAPSFSPWDEENPNPIDTVGGVVFFKNADYGWQVNAPIGDVKDLDYTVAAGTSYAPSFQLVTYRGPSHSYGRLVWEAYMQDGGLGQNAGEYTNLQDGLWWTSKIANPAPGSQSDPQPLSFFGTDGDSGWTDVSVAAIAVHQGSTTESTSLVTKVSYNGHDVALGTPDATPYDQSDIDDATSPLNATIAELTTANTDLTGQVDDLTAANSDLESQITELSGNASDLADQIDDLQSDAEGLAGQIDDLTAAKASLQDQLTALQGTKDASDAQVATLTGQLAGLTSQIADLTSQKAALASQVATLTADKGTLTAKVTSLTAKVAELEAYKAKYNHSQGAYDALKDTILSRGANTALSVSGEAKVGRTLSVVGTRRSGITYKYQWYVAGKKVVGATASTYKLASSAANHTVAVRVTRSFTDSKSVLHTSTSSFGLVARVLVGK